MSSDQVARDRTLWEGSNDLKNGNLLTLPVGDSDILYVEPIYSQRKDQASAFPKLLRVLVFYRGQVGYAPTVSQALNQVGIDSSAAQQIDIVDEGATDSGAGAGSDSAPVESSEVDADTPPAEDSTSTAPANLDEALTRIDDALRGLDDARDGSFEEYGRALDELDRAVESYRNAQ